MTIRGLQKIFLDQMGNHFGISFGGKAMAFFNELSLQRNVILDNAIVNYDDSSGAVAILQPSESFDDDRDHPLLANVSHYAAHANAPIFGGETEDAYCELKSGHSFGRHTTLSEDPAEAGRTVHHRTGKFGQSSREKRNSSITGLVRTSRAMRVTSASTSLRFRPPSSVSSKYLPWRTSSNPLHPIFLRAPWMVFPCGSRTLFLSDTYTYAFMGDSNHYTSEVFKP